MARLVVCGVRDVKLDAFNRPFCAPTVGAAIRAFGDECLRDGTDMFKHPEDFELYQLGFFDETSGEFVNERKQISLASNFKG